MRSTNVSLPGLWLEKVTVVVLRKVDSEVVRSSATS